VWHHDGPFDACRPHRNSKKNALAPINAFPTNSANNTIGGSGPVNPGINLEQFHGMGVEGFHDYGTVVNPSNPNKPFPSMAPAVVNPINRVEPVHGEETMGLGTSTFLEGAPASRQAIQRTQSEQNAAAAEAGIMRKKSIAMRLRGMSNSRRYPDGYPGSSGVPTSLPPPLRSPTLQKGRFQDRSQGVTLSDGAPPLASPDTPTARPATAGARGVEKNPFDTLTEEEDEKKKGEARVSVAETDDLPEGRERALSSPRRGGLERRTTADTDEGGAQKSTAGGGGGFLSRVKSLKGPRRKGDRQAS
jgi:hypothetical protein